MSKLEKIIADCKGELKEAIDIYEYLDIGGRLEKKIYSIAEEYIKNAFRAGVDEGVGN